MLKETLTDVKRPLREAYQRIQGLTREKGGSVSRREIREALRVPDSTVRRWLQDLVDYEYLGLMQAEGERNGQGKAARYRLLDREPQENDIAGLLTPTELGALLEARR